MEANKKALVCYNLFRSFLASQILSDPCFILHIIRFIVLYLCAIFHCSGNVFVRVPIGCIHLVAKYGAHLLHD